MTDRLTHILIDGRTILLMAEVEGGEREGCVMKSCFCLMVTSPWFLIVYGPANCLPKKGEPLGPNNRLSWTLIKCKYKGTVAPFDQLNKQTKLRNWHVKRDGRTDKNNVVWRRNPKVSLQGRKTDSEKRGEG